MNGRPLALPPPQKGAHHRLKFVGSVAGPGARWNKPGSRNPPGQVIQGYGKPSPCNDLPDIQDPKAPFRPLALPFRMWGCITA